MKHKISLGVRFVLALALPVMLAACGGGGGGGGSQQAAPQPKAPGETYTAFIADEVATGKLTFDIDGGLVAGSTTFTLASSATGCTFTSNPADPPDPACNLLPAGAGYLLCDDAVGDKFGLALLKNLSNSVPVSAAEVEGFKFQLTSCGASSLRSLTPTLEISAATSSMMFSQSTFAALPELFAKAFSAEGLALAGLQMRVVLFKVVGLGKTTYFAFVLEKNLRDDPDAFKEPRLYLLERPN